MKARTDKTLAALDACVARAGGTLAARWRAWREEKDCFLIERPHPSVRCLLILFTEATEGDTPEERLLHAIFQKQVILLAAGADEQVREMKNAQDADVAQLRHWVETLPGAELWERLARHPWVYSEKIFSVSGNPEDRRYHPQNVWHGALWHRVCRADALLSEACRAGLPLPGERERLFAALLSSERARFHALRAAFLRHLDRQALHALGPLRSVWPMRAYNWLVASPNAQVRLRRGQALAAAPGLMAHLAGAAQIEAVVDHAQPLVPALAAQLEVPHWVVRAFARAQAAQLAWRGERLLRFTARCLAGLPPERAPRDPASWYAYLSLVDDLFILSRGDLAIRLGHDTIEAACTAFLRKAAKRGWRKAFAAWQRGYRYTQSLFDWDDVARLAERVMPDPKGRCAFYRSLFDRREGAIETIRAFSETFHRELNRRLAESASGLGSLSWPALLPDVQIDGLQVVSLATPGALIEEGRALEHCVGTYALRCLLEPVHVVSLRDAKNRPLSTAELRLEQGDTGFYVRIVQHRGRRNRRPAARLRRVLARYVEVVNARADMAELVRSLEARRQQRAALYRAHEEDAEASGEQVLRSLLEDFPGTAGSAQSRKRR